MARYWRWYAIAVVAVLGTNVMAVSIPAELARGLDGLRAVDAGGDPAVVSRAALHIGLLGAAIVVVRTLSRVWFFTPARLVEFDLREDLFAHLLRLQPDVYARHPTGDLLSRATSDITYARAAAGFGFLQAVNAVAAVVLSLAQMLRLSPALTLACAVPVAVGFAVVQAGSNRLLRVQREVQAEVAAFADQLLGVITGVGTVQAFTVEAVFVDRLDASAARLRALNLTLARLRALVFPVLTVAGGVAVFALLAWGGALAADDRLSAGDLAAFVALLGYLVMPLRLLGVLFPVFQRAEASLERIYGLLDAPVLRPEGPRGLAFPTPGRGPAIELRDLTFAWPDAPDRPVLRGITATLPAGGTVGVFGRTGAGKTALLRLLARLQDPPPGAIRVAGVDIRALDLDDLRRHLVMVPQAPFLFSETLRENVAFGADGARVGPAVTAASLDPDVAALPDGLETVVGERGIVLSGGQRQRVTLARALARDGEIRLFDDVLAAVDHTTEQELLRALAAGAGRATTVLVSHRMSALEACDRVLVLDGGRLVDEGTHAELVARPGLYRDAWLAQRGEGR